jgi:hypothetical protein
MVIFNGELQGLDTSAKLRRDNAFYREARERSGMLHDEDIIRQ